MNRRIRDEADDPLLVRLEELPARLGALADHVGIEPVDFVVTRANRRYEVTGDGGPGRPPHAVRANAVEHRLTVDDWTDEQHATFDDVCGPLMDDLYPGWRDRAPDTEVATNGPEADAGSDRAGPAPGHAAPTLAAVYEQLGELRFADQEFRGLRDDLRELRNRHRAIDEEFRGLREDLQELRGERADLAQRLADERGRRRAAEEAERGATRRRDEAERELADLRAESTAEQRRLRASLSDAVHRAEDERRRRAAVTQSRTYRAALLLRRASIMARKAARRARAVTDRIAPSAGQDRTGDHGASPSDPPATPVADDRAKRVLQIPTVDGGDPAVVYALVVFDVADEELASLLRRVTDEQERHRDVGILWITDSEAFGRFRAVNALFEHIPPRSRWEGHHDGDYDRYRARRLRLLEQSYRPDRTVPVEGSSESWSATLALLDADLVGAS